MRGLARTRDHEEHPLASEDYFHCMCMSVSPSGMDVHSPTACGLVPMEDRQGFQIPWNLSYEQL